MAATVRASPHYDPGMTRVGLVGYGMAGRDIHAPLLQRAGCEVVAVTTACPERVAAVGQDLPAAQVLPVLVHTVYAELASRGSVAEDDAFLSCRHEGGVVSHLGATPLAAVPGPRWRVLGTRGSYLVTGMAGEVGAVSELQDLDEAHCGWQYSGDGRRPVPVQPCDRADFYRQVARALTLGDLATVQAAMPVDPLDSVHVLAVLDAARGAAVDGATQQVLTPGAEGKGSLRCGGGGHPALS